ncbi:heavy metal translocatin [Daldinia caldariorum]|uniref:heavy metal translocatin n=1 Tax=Daldinia caldariorum TaxID=326644 RepID=UPI0020081D00|nr:heavy metal translocatin [Daldinia caldariorum]KAI1470952.1 heavy metal translocatin [Daldinia caldariorum]
MSESKKGCCTAGCCSAPAPTPAAPPPKVEDAGCSSGCCGDGNSAKAGEVDDFCNPPVPENKDCCSIACEASGGAIEPDDCCKPAKPSSVDDCRDTCCRPNEEVDSCCGDKDENAAVPKGSTGCCGSKADKGIEDNCCKLVEAADECCQDSCCDAEGDIDGKFDGPSDDIPQDTCKDACCSTRKPETNEATCCEGKPKPCCDTTCIDRLVLRETAIQRGQGDDANSSSSRISSSKEKSIREKYEIRLAAIGCLCRALIALGQESCCTARDISSEERKRGPKRTTRPKSPKSQEKQAPTCTPKVAVDCCAKSPERKSSTSKTQGGTSCNKGCCRGAKNPSAIKPAKVSSCCSGNASSEGSCCQQSSGTVIESSSKITGSQDVQVADVEKGLSGSERIVLSITGMTCTGCETKLQQTLGRVDAVKNLKTSLVMARVEFQLDSSLATPDDIVKHIERTTEFKCERMATHGSTLDIIPVGGAKQFIQQPTPLGVENVDILDEKTVRITFEPEVIGARDLINHGFQSPVTLAPPQADPAIAAGSKHVRHMGWMTLASVLLTIPVLVLAWAPVEERPIVYGGVSLALATIVQIFIAGPFYPKALKSLVFSRVVEMDLLIVLSTTAAYTFSVVSFGYLVAGQPLSTGNFFETSTLLVTLIMVGRWVSALARQKAVESISIRSLQASTAVLISDDGTEIGIDTRLLQYGDEFKVAPHTQIPTDGIIVSGTTEVDESMLTGESRPIEKKPGSTLLAGSLNGPGTVTVRLTKLPGQNTISTIAAMVDDAKLSKPKIQDLADRIASYFVPVVISLTLITFIAWVAVGVRTQGKSGSEAVTQAITYGITVLIVSCPCAIGLAVPMVIVIACGVAAERGLVFKESEAIEIAHKASHVVFDKTGTLTEGKLSVISEEYLSEAKQDVSSKILGLLADVNHPVSSAVTAHLKAQGVIAAKANEVKSLPGKGVQGYTDGLSIKAGNSRWLSVGSDPRVQAVLSEGHTAFCVTIGSDLVVVFGLADTVRQDAKLTVAELKRRNIIVSMLSGDDDGAVQAVASSLGIPAENALSRCSPADKRAYIQELIGNQTGSNGKEQPVVIFVGDGTNDAVALAQATIGVHVNSGTDVAQSAADVVLMRPSLGGVLTMIDVSRAAVRRVAFNFGWSFVYNLFAILLATGAFVNAGENARIPPEFAGLGELVSVLPVVVVAVSLRWARV